MKKMLAVFAVMVVCSGPVFAAFTPLKLSLFSPLALPPVDKVYGIDIGIFATRSDEVKGIQLGWFQATTTKLYGIQNSILSRSTEATGLQIGFGNITFNEMNGLQIGVVNGASHQMNGLQLGLINIAGTLKGVQIGVVNVIMHGAPVPFMPILNANF